MGRKTLLRPHHNHRSDLYHLPAVLSVSGRCGRSETVLHGHGLYPGDAGKDPGGDGTGPALPAAVYGLDAPGVPAGFRHLLPHQREHHGHDAQRSAQDPDADGAVSVHHYAHLRAPGDPVRLPAGRHPGHGHAAAFLFLFLHPVLLHLPYRPVRGLHPLGTVQRAGGTGAAGVHPAGSGDGGDPVLLVCAADPVHRAGTAGLHLCLCPEQPGSEPQPDPVEACAEKLHAPGGDPAGHLLRRHAGRRGHRGIHLLCQGRGLSGGVRRDGPGLSLHPGLCRVDGGSVSGGEFPGGRDLPETGSAAVLGREEEK